MTVVQGFKGEFDPVISYFKDAYSHARHMTQLIEHENSFNSGSQTVYLMLNAFKGGFLSEEEEVVGWTCRLFAKIAYEFIESGEIIAQAWAWFIDESQGVIETILQALKN